MSQSVREFYAGKNILITGGTGFVGKILVEKLLRCCPDIDTIYLLLRQKKGLSGEERLRELCANKVFGPLREKQPDVFKKLKLISGDILEDELALSNDDRQELQKRVHVVFHSAACVRFDQKLKDAVNQNTTATLRMLQLAEQMKQLEILVHLSTAYCRCDLEVLEEKLYPAVHKPAKVIDICSWMDDDMLNHLEPKLIASEPNTYAYTKAITEDMVCEYGSKFPIAIARPSIVTAALKEPIQGWVDNFNGPTGILAGSGKGVIRTMHCEPKYGADAMPVDVVANGCILLAYATAIDKPKEARFYNITLSGALKNTWEEIIVYGEKWVNVYPPTLCLWYPGGSVYSFWIVHQFFLIFTHLLPAYLVDMMLFLAGQKTFMVNVQKRISHGLEVLQYYTTKQWYFRNTNFKALRNRISAEEDAIFYTDVSNVSSEEYLKHYWLGTRQYCLKEDPSTIPRARKIHKIRYIADRLVKLLFLYLFLWTLYSNSHVFTASLDYLDRGLKRLLPTPSISADAYIIHDD